jgi:hypothetical protein
MRQLQGYGALQLAIVIVHKELTFIGLYISLYINLYINLFNLCINFRE